MMLAAESSSRARPPCVRISLPIIVARSRPKPVNPPPFPPIPQRAMSRWISRAGQPRSSSGALQALDDGDRTVAAAGAADRHREIAAVLAAVTRQKIAQQVREPRHELLGVRLPVEIRPHRPRPARSAPQAGHEVRVRQEAHVEQQVGAVRDAVLEAEADQGDYIPGSSPGCWRSRGRPGCGSRGSTTPAVEDHVRPRAQLGEHSRSRRMPSLPAVGRQGVGPAGLGEAAHQHLVGGFEEEQGRLDALAVDLGEEARELRRSRWRGRPSPRRCGRGRAPAPAGLSRKLRSSGRGRLSTGSRRGPRSTWRRCSCPSPRGR